MYYHALELFAAYKNIYSCHILFSGQFTAIDKIILLCN